MIIKNDYTLRRVDCGDFWRLWELNQKEKLFVFYGFDENCSYIELVQEFEKDV